jgi:integrase
LREIDHLLVHSKYSIIVTDDVRRWINHMAKGAPITATTYFRRLGAYCEYFHTDPAQLLLMDRNERYEQLLQYIDDYEVKTYIDKSGVEQHYTGSYIVSTVKAVKSFLFFHGLGFDRPIKVSNSDFVRCMKTDRMPTPDDVNKILSLAEPQVRIIVMVMAYAGVREKVLGDTYGYDGLILSDIPEMQINGKSVTFLRTPAQLIVRAPLSKTKKQYVTFISEIVCTAIRAFLEMRIRHGEILGPDSALARPKFGTHRFIHTGNIGDRIRHVVRKSGLKFRPYLLRHFFQQRLTLAESAKLLSAKYLSFWAGHKGDYDQYYALHHQHLSEEIIEDMRHSYELSEQYLFHSNPKLSSNIDTIIPKNELSGYLDKGFIFVSKIDDNEFVVRDNRRVRNFD